MLEYIVVSSESWADVSEDDKNFLDDLSIGYRDISKNRTGDELRPLIPYSTGILAVLIKRFECLLIVDEQDHVLVEIQNT